MTHQTPTPTWHLDNVREIAKENPYTFYVPSEQLLVLIEVGDLVKLMFVNDLADESSQYRAERMWVQVCQINGHHFVGVLDNTPYEMHQLKAGDEICFEKQHIMSVYDKDDPVPSVTNQYWDRCWTTKAILDGQADIGFIYRGEPTPKRDKDEYADSGWQILSGDESDEYMDDPKTIQYIALGRLLNIDDGFIHLLDSDIGSAFIKNEQGEWVADGGFA